MKLIVDALAPKTIKQATGQVYQIVQRRIQQIINQGGQQVEKIPPKIIKGAMKRYIKHPLDFLVDLAKNSCIVLVEKLKRFLEDNA